MQEGIGHIAKAMMVLGAVLFLLGALLLALGKLPMIGKLPGDIMIERKNFTFYFPIATSVVLSIALTLILWLLGRR